MNVDVTVLLSAASTIFAGAVLKITENFLSRSKVHDDTASKIRDELRADVVTTKAELEKTEKEKDEIKAQIYAIRAQLDSAKFMIYILVKELRERGIEIPAGIDLGGSIGDLLAGFEQKNMETDAE